MNKRYSKWEDQKETDKIKLLSDFISSKDLKSSQRGGELSKSSD